MNNGIHLPAGSGINISNQRGVNGQILIGSALLSPCNMAAIKALTPRRGDIVTF